MMYRSLVRTAAGIAAALAAAFAHAQADFPNKPVRLVIGFPPGGPTDIVGRPLVARLSQVMGQQVVADYRAGADVDRQLQAELAHWGPIIKASGFTPAP